MGTLTPVTASRQANAVSFQAADPLGDQFANSGKELLVVRHKNAAGSQVTLTVVTQMQVDGLDVADRQIVIQPGEEHLLGPWTPSVYNDPDGNVSLSYSSAADIELLLIKPT